MGCTINTSQGYTKQIALRDKILPATMQSGSEIMTNKADYHSKSIKSFKSFDIQEAKTAQVTQKALIPNDFEFIGEILNSHFLFKDLERESYFSILRTMKYFKLGANEVIFSQGDKGRHLFIIVKGQVDILVNNVKVKTLMPKAMFGEVALIHNIFRTASAVTASRVELWGLDQDNFKKALKTVAAKQFHDNRLCLEKCELFTNLDTKQKIRLLEVVSAQVFNDEVIVKEGETGSHLYIIKYGRVKLFTEEKEICELGEGDYFGEQGLIHDNIRSATAKAVQRVVLLSFDPGDLQRLIGSNYSATVFRNSILISFRNDQFFNKLMTSQMQLIIETMDKKKYKAGEHLLKKDKPIKKIFVILRGSVKRESQDLHKFSVIGSEVLVDHFFTEFSYKCQTPVETAEITKARFEEVLGGNLSVLTSENHIIQQLMSLRLLASIPETTFRTIIKHVQVLSYSDGEVICRQYSNGSCMYIIQSGEVKFTIDGEYIRTLVKGSYFGERALVANSPRTATATSKGETSVICISREVFETFVDPDVRSQLNLRVHLQDDSIELRDLHLLKLLGRGTFGAVFLGIHRETRALYALKTITWPDIRRLRIKKNIKSAEEVLLKVDSPLIMKLVKTIRDDERIYFIQEFVNGKEFSEFIEEARPFNEFQVRFYISNILLMLQHLHSLNIAHRDLKPQNIILDQDGYLKLIDFDTAKKIKERSYTVAGTPHYMAPEMIKGSGYDLTVDLWSLGVIFYEIVYGCLPFANHTDDPIEIYQLVMDGKVEFKNKLKEFRPVIEQLLKANPGNRPDFDALKNDPFFAVVKWEMLLLKKINPPFKPKTLDFDVRDSFPEFSTQLIIEEELRKLNCL